LIPLEPLFFYFIFFFSTVFDFLTIFGGFCHLGVFSTIFGGFCHLGDLKLHMNFDLCNRKAPEYD